MNNTGIIKSLINKFVISTSSKCHSTMIIWLKVIHIDRKKKVGKHKKKLTNKQQQQ